LPFALSKPNASARERIQTEIPMAERPPHVKAPAYLSKSPPVPKPEAVKPAEEHGGARGPEPTRYGDWESGGIARDF
jgi:hypothetical protein